MRIIRNLAALAAIAALGGCATGQGLMSDLGFGGGAAESRGSSNVQAVWRDNVNVTVAGQISLAAADPNQCHLLTVPGEDAYALVGALGGVTEGERVEVTGQLAAWSTCDTYRTLRINRIRRLQPLS